MGSEMFLPRVLRSLPDAGSIGMSTLLTLERGMARKQ